MDLISVIIPVYNTENYIERCVHSLISQSYINIEIILVNDGSTDQSGKKCDKLAADENRIKVIHQKNFGAGIARNAGLKIAKGKYIFFVDSDDYILNDIILKLHNLAVLYDADIVCCGYEIGGRIPTNEYKCKKVDVWDGYEACKRMFIRKGIDSNTVCKLYKNEILQDVTYLSTPYEDVPVTYKVLLKCKRVVSAGIIGYHIEKRINSVTRSDFNETHFLYISLTKAVMNEVKKSNEALLPYAETFHLNAIVDSAEKVQLIYKNTGNVDICETVLNIFANNFWKMIYCPYIKFRKKIICILLKMKIYPLFYRLVNIKF